MKECISWNYTNIKQVKSLPFQVDFLNLILHCCRHFFLKTVALNQVFVSFMTFFCLSGILIDTESIIFDCERASGGPEQNLLCILLHMCIMSCLTWLLKHAAVFFNLSWKLAKIPSPNEDYYKSVVEPWPLVWINNEPCWFIIFEREFHDIRFGDLCCMLFPSYLHFAVSMLTVGRYDCWRTDSHGWRIQW